MSDPVPSLSQLEPHEGAQLPEPRETRKVSALRRFFLLEEELESAKRGSFSKGDPGFYEYERAKEAEEVCAAVLAPREPLRRSDGSRAALSLAREAAAWAAKAHLSRSGRDPGTDLGALWESFLASPVAAQVERSLGQDFTKAIELVQAHPLEALAPAPATSKADLAATRKLVAALLTPLDEATRLANAVHLRRLLRIGTALALVLALTTASVLAIGAWLRGPNLALHKATASSSAYGNQRSTKGAVDGIRSTHGFHTDEEQNPWLSIDLGSVESIGSVVVHNRSDCCQDRAIPLVVETSLDGQQWTQVAKRQKSFSRWKASFPTTDARFVRLTVHKRTYLHLNEVEIYRR